MPASRRGAARLRDVGQGQKQPNALLGERAAQSCFIRKTDLTNDATGNTDQAVDGVHFRSV